MDLRGEPLEITGGKRKYFDAGIFFKVYLSAGIFSGALVLHDFFSIRVLFCNSSKVLGHILNR